MFTSVGLRDVSYAVTHPAADVTVSADDEQVTIGTPIGPKMASIVFPRTI